MGYNFNLFKEVVVSILPLLLLIGSTLGTILTGLATATEAAACGALGSMILAALYGKLTLPAIKGTARSTLLTSAMVLLLVMASNIFGAVFVQLGSAGLIETLLNDLPLPGMGKFLLVMVIVFLLGWPFEWPVIILVFFSSVQRFIRQNKTKTAHFCAVPMNSLTKATLLKQSV